MKDMFKSLWADHKKKIIGLLVSALVALGILSADLRQAIHEATAPAQAEAPAPVAAPAAESK